ncbi:MAG: glycosyltransferase family 2 protein [Pseudomonadota bacterium]
MSKVQPFTVSAVIPLFNKEQAVAASIRSVLAQARTPDELIIVDDGSTDRSREICEDLLSSSKPPFPWRVVPQKNAGASAARNRGAQEAQSRFIAFLDADDEWRPGHLAEIERLASTFPTAAFLSTHSVRVESSGRLLSEPTILDESFFGILERPLLTYAKSRGIFRSPSVAIRSDAWERSGGFPVGVEASEDVFLWVKLCLTEVVAHSGKPLVVVHPEHSSQDSRNLLIGHQFAYFLGSAEGRAFLTNPDLADFLGLSFLAHIKWRRLMGHEEVQPELRRLAQALPWRWRVACQLASVAPLPALHGADKVKEWARRL